MNKSLLSAVITFIAVFAVSFGESLVGYKEIAVDSTSLYAALLAAARFALYKSIGM